MKKKGQEYGSILLSIFAILFVIGLLILALGFDGVEPNHLGVMVRFGKIVGVQEPSYRWTGLFTKVYQYDLRTRKIEIELSGDNSAVDNSGQYVSAKINVNYRVKPNKDTVIELFKNIGTDPYIADRLNIPAIITEGFKQTTVKYDALEIIEKRQDVKELAKENIRINFPSKYFEIENIIITNIDFSKEFKDAIERKKIAEQNKLEEKNKLEVVIYQQKQKIEEYKAQAEQIRLQSQTLTDLTVRQAWIQKWNGQLPTYMIVSPEQSNILLQLPS